MEVDNNKETKDNILDDPKWKLSHNMPQMTGKIEDLALEPSDLNEECKNIAEEVEMDQYMVDTLAQPAKPTLNRADIEGSLMAHIDGTNI